MHYDVKISGARMIEPMTYGSESVRVLPMQHVQRPTCIETCAVMIKIQCNNYAYCYRDCNPGPFLNPGILGLENANLGAGIQSRLFAIQHNLYFKI